MSHLSGQRDHPVIRNIQKISTQSQEKFEFVNQIQIFCLFGQSTIWFKHENGPDEFLILWSLIARKL